MSVRLGARLIILFTAALLLATESRGQNVRDEAARRASLRMAQDLYIDGEFRKAGEALQKVLDLPDLVDSASKENRTFHEQANRILGGFSKEALPFYYLATDGQPEAAMNDVNASAKGHTDAAEKLGLLAARFLYTPQGQGALLSLVQLHLSRGDGTAAAQVARNALSNPGLPPEFQSRLHALLSLAHAIAGQEKESRDALAKIMWPVSLNGKTEVGKNDFEKHRDERQRKVSTVTERDIAWLLEIWHRKHGTEKTGARTELEKIGESNFAKLREAMKKTPAPGDDRLLSRLGLFEGELKRDPSRNCLQLPQRKTLGMLATPDANRFVVYGEREVGVYDGKARQTHTFSLGHDARGNGTSLSSDGKLLVAVRPDPDARKAGEYSLWDVDRGKNVATLKAPNGGEILSTVFTADKSKVITGDLQGNIRVWDVKTGEITKSFTREKGMVSQLALTPDGKQLIAVGRDGVSFWDMSCG